tara:strand:+ start:111 stop:629 length:519 start_codon:yes stop_codon:yes gene_type:complete
MYVGAHWLVTEELPEQHYQAQPRHGPLAQMVVIGSHHLIEIIFFHSVKAVLSQSPGRFPGIENKYDGAYFGTAFKRWPEILVGSPIDTDTPALRSAKALAKRRNATIHKESALAIPSMARSALYSAAHASREIAVHLLGIDGFKYEEVLGKYPPPEAEWFFETRLVDAAPNT